MTATNDLELTGIRGRLVVRRWSAPDPRFIVLLAHDYGEHSGRYGHVAERLVAEARPCTPLTTGGAGGPAASRC